MLDRASDISLHHIEESSILVTIYFSSLALTLSSSVFDPNEGLEVAKSVCGIIGWLVTLKDLYHMVRGPRDVQND